MLVLLVSWLGFGLASVIAHWWDVPRIADRLTASGLLVRIAEVVWDLQATPSVLVICDAAAFHGFPEE